MSANDWEEVKRLAADFQRAQLSSSIQRLSERNCIEIINKLIERNEIDVIFTTDGREYITPVHLVKEMKDELFVHNGRINLVQLAKILSVDLNIIMSRAAEIEAHSSSTTIVNGELIDQNYIGSLCREINERLQQQGEVKLSDLTGLYDLPTDFLRSVIEKELGRTIKAKQDKQDHQIFFTEEFLERNKCTVRGALLALTKPVPVSTLLNLCGIQERLFLTILEEIKSKLGTIVGNQGINSSTYIPSIYLKSQIDWAEKFYAQNGYLEFSALNRLGIPEPISFVKRHFGNANLIILASCAVGSIIFDQVDAAIDEAVATGTFTDIMALLPTVFEEKDTEVILNNVIKKKNSSRNVHIFLSTVVVTDLYLRDLINSFNSVVESKAKECVTSGAYCENVMNVQKAMHGRGDDEKYETKVDRKEGRRRKAAEGKGGGGVLGRETKTKSTKKKYMKNAHNENDEDSVATTGKGTKLNQRLEIIEMSDILEVLNSNESLEEEGSEELIEALAEYLHPILNKSALEKAKTYYEASVSSQHQERRKKHNEMQEKLNDLVLKVKLFEKGYKQFPSKDVQQQFAKYLLKSICTDIANEIFSYVAQDNIKLEGKEMTPEVRLQVINSLQSETKEILSQLHKSLASSSVDDFLNVIDAAVGPGICDIILKKLDKKRERPELLNHRQQLIEQLNVATDPALVLHLATLLVFQAVTQTMLHASGKFISLILSFLQPMIDDSTYKALQLYYDLVLQLLTCSDPSEKSKAEKVLEDEMHSIKNIAVSIHKKQ